MSRKLQKEAAQEGYGEEKREKERTGDKGSDIPRSDQGTDVIEAIMKLVKPEIEVATTRDTQGQKSSLLK